MATTPPTAPWFRRCWLRSHRYSSTIQPERDGQRRIVYTCRRCGATTDARLATARD